MASGGRRRPARVRKRDEGSREATAHQDSVFLEQKLSDFNGLKKHLGTSLVVQWLGLHASPAGSKGSVPGRGTMIPQAEQQGPPPQKKRRVKETARKFIKTQFLGLIQRDCDLLD